MRRWNDGRLRPSRSRCVLERPTRASGLTIQGAVPMQLAIIGLGRMGGNMVRRLLQGGHELVVYDSSADAVEALVAKGVTAAKDLADVAQRLAPRRVVWVMV